MDRLLGHLAQFGSFSQQGELLCTQGLAYLLRDPEGEQVFRDWISSAAGHPLSSGLSWKAELHQEDRGRPDLEGRNARGQGVVKIEAKLRAPFGEGQLDSYLSALCAGGQGMLLILVPKSRLEETTSHAIAHFGIVDAAPWRIRRETVQIPCTVVTWEDMLEALFTVKSEHFRDDLSQFRAMYRVFNGDYMEPITSDEQFLAWRDREERWKALVDLTARALTAPGGSLLPSKLEGGTQPYWGRHVEPPESRDGSCFCIGTRDPFLKHQTPIWLRFHSDTPHFAEIARRLDHSELLAVSSQGHLWFPLEVPRDEDSETVMVRALVEQVQRIVAVAYPQAASAEPHPTL